MIRRSWLALAAVLLCPGTARSAPVFKWELELNAGAGFDSNATRVEPCTGFKTAPSALTYGSGLFTGTWAPNPKDAVKGELLLGGKEYLSRRAKGQSLHFHKLQLGWTHLFSATFGMHLAASWLESNERSDLADPGSAATSSDATPLPEVQDFRFLSSDFTALWKIRESIQLHATGTLLSFTYRPDDRLSFTGFGGELGMAYRHAWGKTTTRQHLELAASYRLNRHLFSDTATESGPRRQDMVHSLAVGASYLGSWLFNLTYGLRANVSNSPSWSAVRHTVSAKGAFPLFWKLMAVVKLTYQYMDYPEAVLLYAPASPESFQRLDEESRSSVLVSIQRPIGRGYSLHLRYIVYLGLAVETCHRPYQRHLVLFEFIYNYPWQKAK
jgi:hypothetical protein